MNHLFIRSDASPTMGAGHIMRSLALGQAWKKRGGAVTFISHCLDKKLSKKITDYGLDFIDIKHMCPDTQDLRGTLEILNNHPSNIDNETLNNCNWVILDGYHFTPDYQKALVAKGYNLMVIDDCNHLDLYSANILLNQNIGADNYAYNCTDDTIKLLGTKYILLRSEFLKGKKTKPKSYSETKNILITMGGADPDHITLKVLQAIDKIKDPEFQFKVIIGPKYSNSSQLKEAIRGKRSNIAYIENADMTQMMTWADIAVTAGGSTCWELCFMKVPLLVITIAENQYDLTRRLENVGAAIYLGDKKTVTSKQITEGILKLASDLKKQNDLKENGARIVDGKGTKRILRHMLVGTLFLRPVKFDDAMLLHGWANDKEVRSLSFTSDPIPWDKHIEWLKQKLADKNSWGFIATNQAKMPVGQIRFDLKDGLLNISYLVDKCFRELGMGKHLLKAGMDTIQKEIQRPEILQGKIKKNNLASIISFKNCGFTRIKKNGKTAIGQDHNVYQLKLNPANFSEKS